MARVKSLFSAHKTHGMSCAARIALSLLTRMVSYGKDSSSFVPVFGADRIPAHAPRARENVSTQFTTSRGVISCRSAPSNAAVLDASPSHANTSEGNVATSAI